jgi:hypothetical protein
MENTISTYKPDVSKRGLLLAAGFVWLALGFIFVNKSSFYIIENSHHILFHLMIGLVSGILFFLIFFFRISKKYTCQIIHLSCEKPCILSYANFKVYLLTALIIGISFYLKKTDTINHIYLSIAFISIGISLLLASIRFFYSCIAFKKIANNNKRNPI